MKNLKTFLLFLLVGITANATTVATPEAASYNKYDGKAYIFIEGGVEFSVFPDGQFDFVYVGTQNGTEVTITSPNINVSYNGGYDYETYVQYDDYGAIIQVEDVAVFYDEYGRISQAGTVDIRYRNRRLVRVGGLRVIYNNAGYYDYCTGFINPFNRFYVYRPWHVYYARPIYNNCIVWDVPYRRYYTPIRYSYYNHTRYYKNRYTTPYNNCRRDFYRPGSRVHYRNGRTAVNRDYREGRRNTMVNNHGRRETGLARTNTFRDTNARTTSSRDVNTRTSRNTVRTPRTSSRTIAQNTRTRPRNTETRAPRVRTTKPATRANRSGSRSSSRPKARSQRTSKPMARTNSTRPRTTIRPSTRNTSRGNSRSSAPKRSRGL